MTRGTTEDPCEDVTVATRQSGQIPGSDSDPRTGQDSRSAGPYVAAAAKDDVCFIHLVSRM